MRDLPNQFSLPRRISRLGQLAYNLWWVWNPEAQMLFTNINKSLWDAVNHNPVAFLHKVERRLLNAVTNDRYYLEFYDRVMKNFDSYLNAQDTWYATTYPNLSDKQVAYFSFEFGLHESLPVYAGGLGILAGDHLKEASDLGIPLVAIGFIYNKGYFVQHITEDGWQETRDLILDFDEMPVVPVLDKEGKPLMISVELPGRSVFARIWEVRVGRVMLYLLDTNLDENNNGDRQLTARLYSNDLDIRISQEILLGMGGVRALRLLGYHPDVWHMNEGHSAFLALERALELVRTGKTFDEATAIIEKTNVFTTHTPVPAGNDQFPIWLVDKYFAQVWPELGLTRDQFVNLGHQVQPWGETFCMPVLALKLSDYRNAVSELHGQVSRRMWNWIWPEKRPEEVPITHITNGVHTGTFLARRLRLLFDRYLGTDWMKRIDDPELWAQIANIPDGELWQVRRHLKRKLVVFANTRTRALWQSGSITPAQVVAGGLFLEPYSLTIGFARRFATYKRANLIFRDYDRLLRLITNYERPVQIVFAGKAHPADEPGKLLIQQVYRAVKDSKSGGRLVFLEDYDMNVARYLVQGVDVWLNTPRRPNEASGTSGMKAALNGVLNFSVLDGWWREGYNGKNGWAIGEDLPAQDAQQQDDADAESLYNTLENEIIPLYYENRTADNLPSEWVGRIKESMRTLAPMFSTRRMVKEYMTEMYESAMQADDD
ncbi:maltodextrin phosphorylase [Longilinea arvoryzae]|uniref:glycogen phosphorylase n=1 Tax=Longilinea arvoryzae TaxID=360412 RepID=A0A0S7B8Q0_9CHLR|nr:alpha-glucan family phosphorylase [Longilinea arvoryzae]GAP13887.1 maltodextrin phosphorylase [Longilinea arvoryzae]